MEKFKKEIESLLIAAQNNAISTNHIRTKMDNTQQNIKCRLCGDKDKTIYKIISEYSKLTQKYFKTWYNWAGKLIQGELSK